MSVDFFPEKGGNHELDLNVANGNAAIPCAMMGASYSDYSIPTPKLGEALAKVLSVAPIHYTRDTVEINDGGPHIVFCGVTEQQASRYRQKLEALLYYCIQNQVPLCWG